MGFRVTVKITLPSKQFAGINIKKSIQNKITRETEREVLKDFEGTVEGWENRPQFKSERISNSRTIGIKVYPVGRGLKQYNIVSFGSPPHIITAKRPSRKLKFRAGYRASTRPGSLLSSSNSRSGGYISTYFVNHPGFEGRDFAKQIADKNAERFYADMQEAIDDAVKNWEG